MFGGKGCVCACSFVCVCMCYCVCVSIGDCLSQHCLCWFGHISHVDDDRLPKQMFVEGIASHSRHGPKKRWRDSVMGDLQSLGVSDGWLMLAQEREQWRRLQYQQQPRPQAAKDPVCECSRQFRRRDDIS